MIWLLPPLFLWLTMAAVLFAGQRRMVFPGRSARPLGADALAGVRVHRIAVPGGEVDAWWLPAAPGTPRPAPAVLFFHGNLELIEEWVHSFDVLRRAGMGVLLIEYPGYGRSTGIATQETVTGVAVDAWELAAAMKDEVDPTRIVALGRSLGGGAASALSRERSLAALLLSSSFTGIRAYARRYLLPGFLVRHPFDNEAAVGAFPGPVLVQHGTRDHTVPFDHGVRLAAVATDAELLRYECGHNDCPWDLMMEDVVAFLTRRGLLPTAGNPGGPSGVG